MASGYLLAGMHPPVDQLTASSTRRPRKRNTTVLKQTSNGPAWCMTTILGYFCLESQLFQSWCCELRSHNIQETCGALLSCPTPSGWRQRRPPCRGTSVPCCLPCRFESYCTLSMSTCALLSLKLYSLVVDLHASARLAARPKTNGQLTIQLPTKVGWSLQGIPQCKDAYHLKREVS